MTTVGYGDISPETETGRVIAIVVMLVGIGFLAVLTGAVAERFLTTRVEEAADRRCRGTSPLGNRAAVGLLVRRPSARP